MSDDDLNIPESNREIALHLRAINARLTCLETTVNEVQTSIEERRFRVQDLLLSALILPVVGGMVLFLLTKALG